MIYVLAALTAVLATGYPLAGWLVLGHLRDRDIEERLERTRASEAYQTTFDALMERVAADRAAHRREVADLCQRIQAPEVAVIQHQQDNSGPGEAIYPMTDEESAQQQDALRVALDEIERIENEGVLP